MVDSRPDTYAHIHTVQKLLMRVVDKLQSRLLHHDETKLHSPEVELFDEHTAQLSELEFGSDEYKACLAALKPALDHHYSHNAHHPEFWGASGIRGMSLIDLLEMICDWKAATYRMKNGDVYKSIEINQGRFGYSDELADILRNTVRELDG